jgi:hypothetical protein
MAKRIRIDKLGTIEGVSLEYQRIYRAARRGTLEIGVASKLAYMLKNLAAIHSDHDLEKRIEQLEQELNL